MSKTVKWVIGIVAAGALVYGTYKGYQLWKAKKAAKQ
jgi:hypothetical protein